MFQRWCLWFGAAPSGQWEKYGPIDVCSRSLWDPSTPLWKDGLFRRLHHFVLFPPASRWIWRWQSSTWSEEIFQHGIVPKYNCLLTPKTVQPTLHLAGNPSLLWHLESSRETCWDAPVAEWWWFHSFLWLHAIPPTGPYLKMHWNWNHHLIEMQLGEPFSVGVERQILWLGEPQLVDYLWPVPYYNHPRAPSFILIYSHIYILWYNMYEWAVTTHIFAEYIWCLYTYVYIYTCLSLYISFIYWNEICTYRQRGFISYLLKPLNSWIIPIGDAWIIPLRHHQIFTLGSHPQWGAGFMSRGARNTPSPSNYHKHP